MDLTLSDEELAILTRVLKNYLPNLSGEIGKTENLDWRTSMHKDQEVLEAILARLEAAAHPSTAT